MDHNRNVKTYYEILEIDQDAPQHEIHRAYQRAKDTYSPDSPALYTMFTEEEAKDLLKLIEEAYNTLGNHGQREAYDRQLAAQEIRIQDEESLPDFQPPGHDSPTSPQESSAESSAPSTSKTSDPLPAGFARTRFSVYEQDETLEGEIASQSLCDGEFLQKVRLYKKINLEQISSETRISRSYLSAIEANDYLNLPAPVFVRGFVVQVARLLGLEESRVASSYMQIMKHGKH